MTDAWALEVSRADLSATTLLDRDVPEPADGQAVLRAGRRGGSGLRHCLVVRAFICAVVLVSGFTPVMRARLVVGALALVILGGGVALVVQKDETACDRYKAAAERQDYASFGEQQRVQGKALAECMAEEARTGR